ncbi:MAG: hypothetical protein GW795_11350 [Cyanobacteria bacterium]|nr:hypothetical protein [Cyanobacteria bacterium CG_2015-16_32_12]NCO77115.1 hypothetical protein [Cyanobacteria bacterium CG_2015-22_32_23]NCQ03942.1 hypothetical protein [Cyanobacteria bacterium CG_2015-09_32_10]NCQ42450.1 hypothetical protein [Cyanobacteria bacterium CG_2015-04_32_10]NCS85972.1 hypothetical protein [Cyanobacteria bacterium CG_2015-02_32_10]
MNSSESSSKPILTDVDWYAVACKIRKQNQQLKEQILKLETSIEEQKKQIKVQVIKNQDYLNLITDQSQKITELSKEVDDNQERIKQQSKQYNQQKLSIENLTQELKKTQQLAASLERECSLLQDDFNSIKHSLKQKEKENKELQIRLQRQQRSNIQYKTALDNKYLTNPPDVNSLGIKSWSEIESNNSSQNGNNTIQEQINNAPDIPEIIYDNHPQEEKKSTNYLVSESKILSENNLNIIPAKKENNNSSKKLGNSQDNIIKKTRKESFLKLPKWGK